MQTTMTDQTIRLPDGRQLGYAEYGDPKGMPLLFFHGTPGSRLRLSHIDPLARDLGVRVVAPERPGFGLSDSHVMRNEKLASGHKKGKDVSLTYHWDEGGRGRKKGKEKSIIDLIWQKA